MFILPFDNERWTKFSHFTPPVEQKDWVEGQRQKKLLWGRPKNFQQMCGTKMVQMFQGRWHQDKLRSCLKGVNKSQAQALVNNRLNLVFVWFFFWRVFCTEFYGFKYSYLIQIICTQFYDIKYSYLIQIICTQFYDIKYSYLIQIICTQFYDIKYSYLQQIICTQFYDIKYSYLQQIICTQFYDIKYSYWY